MSKIKEAYDALVMAIQEETGCVPSINIYLHSNINIQLQDQSEALKAATIMASQLTTIEPAFIENEENKWYSIYDGGQFLNIAVFM